MAQKTIVSAITLFFFVAPVYAGNLCTANSFTLLQAVQGKRQFNSSCGLCHQYNLQGRVPGNGENETPDIRILDSRYTKTIDGNGGVVPPLIGKKFLDKWKDQKAFQTRISTAIDGFPPKDYVKVVSDQRVAAYILYENCGKLK